MSIDTEQTPQTSRRRSGLAKLRGEADPVVAPPRPDAPESVDEPGLAEAPRATASPDAVEEAPPEAVPSSAAATKKVRRGGRRLQIVVLALVAVVAVLATLVASGWDRLAGASSGSSGAASVSADERFAALRAARQFAVSFFTYDYRKIGDYFHRIEGASTGGFRSDFVSKETILKTTLSNLKTVATGHVSDAGAGISSISGNSAVALVAADMDASNAVTKNGQKRYRVKLALQRVNGVWLVSDFQQVV